MLLPLACSCTLIANAATRANRHGAGRSIVSSFNRSLGLNFTRSPHLDFTIVPTGPRELCWSIMACQILREPDHPETATTEHGSPARFLPDGSSEELSQRLAAKFHPRRRYQGLRLQP